MMKDIMISMDKLEQMQGFLAKIEDDLVKRNRFFVDIEFIELLNRITSCIENNIEIGTVYFRAREYSKNIKEISERETFEGYDEEGSFVNKNTEWPNVGRMNPQGISVLYVSSGPLTAITEIHPYYGCIYSVATIKVIETLKVVDFSIDKAKLPSDLIDIFSILQERLSKGDKERDSVFTQYIASFCLNLGYDGIVFRSKYSDRIYHNEGLNVAIFNYEKTEPIASKLYSVAGVTTQIRPYYDRYSFGKADCIKELLEVAIEEISNTSDTCYNQIILKLLVENKHYWVLFVCAEKITIETERYDIVYGHGMINDSFCSMKTIVNNDVHNTGIKYYDKEITTQSEVAIPIIARGHSIGVINCESTEVSHFNRQMVDELENISEILGCLLIEKGYSEEMTISEIEQIRINF